MPGGRQESPDEDWGHLLVHCRVASVWEDTLASLLASHGCLGVQPVGGLLQPASDDDAAVEGPGPSAEATVDVELVFTAPTSPEATQGLEIDLRTAFGDFRAAGVDITLVGMRHDPGTDWLAVYRASAQPIRVGTVLIDPREEAPRSAIASAGESGDLLRLHLPAEQAFGTGSHETTQAMLLLLQSRSPEGCTVLDVGCGSGVLSFVALAQGARCAVGIEIDPASTFVARRNELRNRSNDWHACHWVTGTIDSLAVPSGRPEGRASAGFDLVLVNVLPHRIHGQEEAISRQLAADGELWVGGLLVDQVAELTERWQAFGLRRVAVEELGEWATLVFRPCETAGAP